MRIALLLLLPALLSAEDGPQLFFSKSFPGSRPAYEEIKLTKDGKIEYREAPNEEDPIEFKLLSQEAEAVFQLADKLDHFNRPIESGLKVARMGEKTFRWEDGTKKSEQKFNYSTDADAQALLDWFEKMCESAQHHIDLERAVRYDKLGVHQALLKLEAAWDGKRLVGLEQFLPLLDRVVKNEAYMNMARERAEKLAVIFRAPAAPSAQGQP